MQPSVSARLPACAGLGPAVTAQSGALVDTLPKIYGDAGSAGVEAQLEEKRARHAAFLTFLQASGAWASLTVAEQCVVLEHGEKVAAAQRLRQLYNEAAAAGEESAAATYVSVGSATGAALMRAVRTAGATAKASTAGAEERAEEEVFYAYASGVEGFCNAVTAAMGPDAGSQSVVDGAEAADELLSALLAMADAAGDQRALLVQMYPPPALEVASLTAPAAPLRWVSRQPMRDALRAVAKRCVVLREAAAAAEPSLRATLAARVASATAPLLDACAAALAAAVPGSEERAVRRTEYHGVRAELLPILLAAAREDQNAPAFATVGSATQPRVTIDDVAALAEAHRAYDVLFEIADTIGGPAHLHHCMRTLRPSGADEDTGFAPFAFSQLVAQERHAELLRDTPAEFNEVLLAFLTRHPSLLWLQQLRVEQYADASKTLLGLGTDASGATAGERRRNLALGKLALLASGGAPDSAEAQQADAGLELLRVQREVIGDSVAAEPGSLAEACLAPDAGPEALMSAFDVFAAAGGAWRSSNTGMIEAAFKRAADATDWAALASTRGRTSDDAYTAALAATPLARATFRCFATSAGPEAPPIFGVPFADAVSPDSVEALLTGTLDPATHEVVRAALHLFQGVLPEAPDTEMEA